jgi:hypothetical protein
MTSDERPAFRMVDRRHTASADDSRPRPPAPPGYRAHKVLLGYLSDSAAREFLRDKAVYGEAVDALLEERERARERIRSLAPLAAEDAARPVQDGAAMAEISRVMGRPECKAAFPDGSWRSALVDIAKLIPAQPSLDIDYAESLGGPWLDAGTPISAVRLCFAQKHPTPVQVSVDQGQKSVNLVGIHPAFEVVSLRCSQQGDDGPLVVSFLVTAPPDIVVVLHHARRHFLAGGYHRAYRLMQAGFTHIPCIVREAPGFAQIAPASAHFHESVLMAPRPPLFPDFADPTLGIVAHLRAMRRVIRIRPDEYLVSA